MPFVGALPVDSANFSVKPKLKYPLPLTASSILSPSHSAPKSSPENTVKLSWEYVALPTRSKRVKPLQWDWAFVDSTSFPSRWVHVLGCDPTSTLTAVSC
jgi:hypothetical protein